MSLTSHLARKDSPVRAFMQQHFSATRSFAARHNKKLRSLNTLRPRSDDAPFSLLGTAVDYRIRYYFKNAINQRLVAQNGAYLLSPYQPLHLGNIKITPPSDVSLVPYPTLETSAVSTFFCTLLEFVERLPYSQLLKNENKKTLCRYYIVLTYFNQTFRTGPNQMANTPLLRNRCPPMQNLLSLAEPDWVKTSLRSPSCSTINPKIGDD